MRIVGYNLSHDSSIAVVEDGHVVAALALERLSRVKRGTVPAHVFASEMGRLTEYVLASRGLNYGDIDHWIGTSTETQNQGEESELFSLLGRSHGSGNILQMPFPGHHLAHASAAFHCSGFERAGVLIVDAYGSLVDGERERETAYLFEHGCAPVKVFQYRRDATRIAGRREGSDLVLPETFSGVGELYRVVTLGLGFCEHGTSYDDAGKTMGLAAYGEPFSREPLFIRKESSDLSFDLAAQNLKDLGLVGGTEAGMRVTPYTENETGRVRREDIAAQIQYELEVACIGLVEDLVSATSERRLAASGGCFLNSVLNRRLLRERVIDELFVFPAATDDGNAVGAALYAYHHILSLPSLVPQQIGSVCWGPSPPDDADIESEVSRWPVEYVRHRSQEDVAKRAAAAITRGEIIGWFQGRSEFGPRALGARSILCHPGMPNMKAKLNRRIKFREPFRPFAASILNEDAADWFVLPALSCPFMLMVCDVRPERCGQVREVVHVDGTCRIQTVDSLDGGVFRKLLVALKELEGLPLALNTSFNLRGMPIVERPAEAIDCLFGSRLDRVFVGNVEIEAPDFSALTPRVRRQRSLSATQTLNDIADPSLLAAFDGSRTLGEIAKDVGLGNDMARDAALELRHLQVLDWCETPQRPLPRFLGSQYEPSKQ